ncbi:unnamed protein product, partial [Heligmosomoides polygyrus]|uniref:CBFD_NFYB_HMF domain-containing protein n=1 Tax=Heligmosomoides polygyrus TaxID=6339 RepID=A0A183FV91_HELPZ
FWRKPSKRETNSEASATAGERASSASARPFHTVQRSVLHNGTPAPAHRTHSLQQESYFCCHHAACSCQLCKRRYNDDDDDNNERVPLPKSTVVEVLRNKAEQMTMVAEMAEMFAESLSKIDASTGR